MGVQSRGGRNGLHLFGATARKFGYAPRHELYGLQILQALRDCVAFLRISSLLSALILRKPELFHTFLWVILQHQPPQT